LHDVYYVPGGGMTREDIIRMAREAGGLNCDCCLPEPEPHEMQEFIERFAKLVAAHEREECAKVANAWQTEVLNPLYSCDCATAIRRRGKP
jgi:hypothetical protein